MPSDAKSHARRVLRDIRDPGALRANPLTERFFRPGLQPETSLLTIRALVVGALPPGSRARRIVEECDLAGRAHKTVRREMVLSERQFYRERAHAIALIARAFEHEPATVANADAHLALRIESLHDLLAAGHALAVRRLAEQTLTTHVPDWAASRLYALIGSAYSRDGDDAEADRALHQAQALACGDIERSDVLTAQGLALCQSGALPESIGAFREAARLTGTEAILADPAGLRAHARHLYWLANAHEEMDDASAALAILDDVHGLLLSRSPHDLSMLASVKIEMACAAMCLPGQMSRARHELNDAFALACRIAAPALQARVELLKACASIAVAPADTLLHARLAIELARSSLAGEELARALLTCGRVLTACGDAPGALGLIEIARAHYVPGRYIEAISTFRHADALAMVGRHEESARLAEDACSRIASVNRSHYLGSAHVSAAVSESALGRTSEAMEHVEAALPLLESSGFVFEYKRANQLAARISGDARYVRRAEEIGRLMTAS